MKILLIDNHDSFVYNIVGLFCRCGVWRGDISVVRNDAVDTIDIGAYSAIVLSPGPGLPSDAGALMRVVAEWAGRRPMLGICLGHQAIVQHFGATLERLSAPRHGHPSQLRVTDLSDPLVGSLAGRGVTVGRYHSWRVREESLPPCLRVTSVDEDGGIMSVSHTALPVWGLQFHPESVITDCGEEIINNMLKLC